MRNSYYLLFVFSILTTLLHSETTETEKWLQKIAETTDDRLKVDYHVDLAEALSDSPDIAIHFLTEALQLAEKIEYRSGQADLYNAIGISYWRKGDLPTAIAQYEKALELRIPGTDDQAIATLQGNIGIAHMMLSNFDSAIESLRDCYENRKKGADSEKIANACLNLASAQYYSGNYEKSIELLVEAAELYEKLDNKAGLSSVYNNIAAMYLEFEDLKKAESYLYKALEFEDELVDTSTLASCYGTLGNIHFQKENFEEAIKYYSKVLSLDHESSLLADTGNALNGLGEVHRKQNRFDEARNYYEQAIVSFEKAGNRQAKSNTMLSLSELHYEWFSVNTKTEHLNHSAKFASQALQLAKDIAFKPLEAKAYQQLYLTYKQLGDRDKAMESLEQYTDIKLELLDAEKHEQIAKLETKYQVETKNREIETLTANNRIQELELNEQHLRVKAQRRFIVIILSFSGMSLGIILMFVKWNQARQQNEKNELKIRNLQTEQKVLRSQMNPHFIYNSLNSIQSFISSNDSFQAENYLAKFANLMRGILLNSMHDWVILEMELDVLRSYLELEQLRFENRFQFEIKIDEDIEEDFIKIPPMLIQPFLENSILHGFDGSQEKGNLLLEISEHDSHLKITIDDNGIGREGAAQKPRKPGKKSLATEITKQRLEVVASEAKSNTSITIEDKKDPNSGQATGTKVVMLIPLVETH